MPKSDESTRSTPPILPRVCGLDHFSYKAIVADALTVLKHVWWPALICVSASFVAQYVLNGQLVDFMSKPSDGNATTYLYLTLLLRSMIQALHFLAAVPVIAYFKLKLDMEPFSLTAIVKETAAVSWQVMIIGTVFVFIQVFGPVAAYLYSPVGDFVTAIASLFPVWGGDMPGTGMMRQSLGTIFVSVIMTSILVSFLVLFPVVAVFRRTSLLKTFAGSIRLIIGNWWKLALLFPLLDVSFFPYDLLVLVVPIEISQYAYLLLVGLPVSILAIVLTIVVYLMLATIREKASRKSP